MTIIPDELKKANRYHLTMVDMQEAKRFLDACLELEKSFQDEVHEVAIDALVIAAIVSYCRPFKKSYSDGFAESRVKIEDYHWVKNNPEQISSTLCWKESGTVSLRIQIGRNGRPPS
jgi:hypothetical protein